MKLTFLPLALLVLLGAGCVATTTNSDLVVPPVVVVDPAPVDPYEGWLTVAPGGVISLRIPPNCTAEGAAGSTFVVCPENPGDTPPPDMVISSDGQIVNIRRWEDLQWNEWDKVIASLRVLTPLRTAITISIQK